MVMSHFYPHQGTGFDKLVQGFFGADKLYHNCSDGFMLEHWGHRSNMETTGVSWVDHFHGVVISCFRLLRLSTGIRSRFWGWVDFKYAACLLMSSTQEATSLLNMYHSSASHVTQFLSHYNIVWLHICMVSTFSCWCPQITGWFWHLMWLGNANYPFLKSSLVEHWSLQRTRKHTFNFITISFKLMDLLWLHVRVFTHNNYPTHLTRRCLIERKTKQSNTANETKSSHTTKETGNVDTTDETSNPETTEVKLKFLCLLYIRGLSESIERSCKPRCQDGIHCLENAV